MLHVGKTGGTALTHVLLEQVETSRYRLLLHAHEVTLAHVPRGERFMFILRDPISRFASAFTSRRREGRPRYHYPWREEERLAFAIFKTPDELGAGLSSLDPERRTSAERAMRGIAHIDTPYRHWFGTMESFRGRLADVFFVAFQDQLDDDFELLKRKLGLPAEVRLPADPITGHRSLDAAAAIGEAARANLERWYEEDLVFVDHCRRLAPTINRDELRGSGLRAPVARRKAHARYVAWRYLLPPVAAVAGLGVTAALVEAVTDRDWSLSGFEWPRDFATAAALASLVPVALRAASAVLPFRRARTAPPSRGEEAR